MPLPAALLAKLQRRGIVKQEGEEVIAENYDGDGGEEARKREENTTGATGCPNKNNPYHLCVEYCYDHWQDGTPENRLSEVYMRRKKRMLTKYPLPEGWKEVYDPGLARHYYWSMDTDEVSWLSPRHPLAVIGEAAPQLAREMVKPVRPAAMEPDMRGGGRDRDRDGYRDRDRDYDRDRDRRSDHRGGRERGGERRHESYRDRKRRHRGEDEDDQNSEDEIREKKDMSERDRLTHAKKKGLDPMDPAAYGNAPKGGWGAGLHADDKSGADQTAGGPLFQQRPYPAPGAILRAQGKKNDNDD